MPTSSSGLLLYAAAVDLLAEDFLSHEAQMTMTKSDKITAFCWVLLGGTLSTAPERLYPDLKMETDFDKFIAAGMSIVGAFA